MRKKCVSEHDWSAWRSIREPDFGVTFAGWQVCKKCGWREYENYCDTRASGGTPKLLQPERVCDAAVKVLRETDNPAVMWGDEGLLHLIAERLGWEHDAWHTSDRVLAALSKTPGPLIKKLTTVGNKRYAIFRLPEP